MADFRSGPVSGGVPGPTTLAAPVHGSVATAPMPPPPAGPRGEGKPPAADGARAHRAPSRYGGLVAWRYFDAVFLLALMALSLVLRWRTLWTSYWGDEAIAIGIATHSLGSLPHYLVNDGSPPLYYVALHYWMELFGRSEPATHSLSMVPALLAVPAAWWCGERLFGRSAARIAAALVATCAYLDYYSTETRMYSWLVLVAMLAVSFFVLAYRGDGKRYWAGATVLMCMVLYLQYYGLYLFAVTVAAGLATAAVRRCLPKARATAGYAVACTAIFSPWVPQFLYQLHHTGAPWAPHPAVTDFFGDSFNALASAGWAGVVFGIVVAVLGRPRRPRGPVTSGAGAAVTTSLVMTVAILLGTLVVAWCVGQFVNSWNPRYLGIAVVPALLPLAAGLARARWGRMAAAVAFLSLTATAVPMIVDRSVTVLTAKSDAAYLMGELKPQLRPGALVISSEVTDTPVFALDLGPGYRYATPLGLLKDPLVVNWSNLPTRLQSTVAAKNLSLLIDALPPGGQVVIVNPTTWGGGETPEKYASAVEAEAIAADDYVTSDPALSEVRALGVPRYSNPLYPMEATLFVKR